MPNISQQSSREAVSDLGTRLDALARAWGCLGSCVGELAACVRACARGAGGVLAQEDFLDAGSFLILGCNRLANIARKLFQPPHKIRSHVASFSEIAETPSPQLERTCCWPPPHLAE